MLTLDTRQYDGIYLAIPRIARGKLFSFQRVPLVTSRNFQFAQSKSDVNTRP